MNIPTLNRISIRKIVFTSDIFRIDDRVPQHNLSPQRINIEWVSRLFSPILENLLSLPSKLLTGEEPGNLLYRISAFRKLGVELSSDSWASYYGGLGNEEVETAIAQELYDSLVIGFEMPPYMIDVLSRKGIPYIDLANHPVRFLPDYMFGVRSNVTDIATRLRATSVPEKTFYDFARISAARTVRIMRGKRPDFNSALFLGQIEVDSSLVQDGRVVGQTNLQDALIALRGVYNKVYYKFHPHREDKISVMETLKGVGGCEVIEINVYDALACDEFDLVAAFSSGALHEARYFGKRTKRILTSADLFYSESKEELGSKNYIAAPRNIFDIDYWRYILGDTEEIDIRIPDFTENAHRYSLNMRWGR